MSVQEDYLQGIADAIRDRDGTDEPIQASTFPERIRAIPASGGEPGPAGPAAGFGEVTATVDEGTGVPSVEVTASGPDTEKAFAFAFHNLKGTPGADGGPGPKGADGKDGLNGTNGKDGARGSQWFSGTALTGTSSSDVSSSSLTEDYLEGDYYLNTSYGYVYRCTTAGTGTGAKWRYQGSIRGATGSSGSTGSQGPAGPAGPNTAAGLKAAFADGPTVLSSYQYGDTLPAAGTPGRLFFLKISL